MKESLKNSLPPIGAATVNWRTTTIDCEIHLLVTIAFGMSNKWIFLLFLTIETLLKGVLITNIVAVIPSLRWNLVLMVQSLLKTWNQKMSSCSRKTLFLGASGGENQART